MENTNPLTVRILDIQSEIKSLETQNTNLFTVIKGAILAKQFEAKKKYQTERHLIAAKLVGLRTEMETLRNFIL